MSFLNKKEDVFDIQLTPYGKKMLSRGLFRPAFYTFHDTEIVYDAKHYNVEENQNLIEQRIGEVPYIHQQTRYLNAEKPENSDLDLTNFLGAALGSLDDIEQKAPAFEINFHGSVEIESIDDNSGFAGDLLGTSKIRQINLKPLTVKIIIEENFENSYVEQTDSKNIETLTDKKPDGTFVYLDVPEIKLSVIEKNIESISKNFIIELHKISQDNSHEKLLFTSTDSPSFSMFLGESSNQDANQTLPSYFTNYVNSYFYISQDVQQEVFNRLFIYQDDTETPEEICRT